MRIASQTNNNPQAGGDKPAEGAAQRWCRKIGGEFKIVWYDDFWVENEGKKMGVRRLTTGRFNDRKI